MPTSPFHSCLSLSLRSKTDSSFNFYQVRSTNQLPTHHDTKFLNQQATCVRERESFPSVLVYTLHFTSIMSSCKCEDSRIHGIKNRIRVVPNFPKPGIMFQDITTLLLDHKAFKNTIDLFIERYKHKNISVVAGIEARGFIFGPPIALAIGAKFVPMRKPRKLPEEYILEYGTDCLEMHIEAVKPTERALVVDDLIATGGTLCAAIRLLERVGAEVVECACVIELPELKFLVNFSFVTIGSMLEIAGSREAKWQAVIYIGGILLRMVQCDISAVTDGERDILYV
ncbi:hypothetical protein IFM89_014171 [Coptis chinensis]|uniref:adenine phosphoribosyltransferase n=1 Tax=Coptis chinensis TaxID=261450 RepID=A0A835IDV5_9MAGN|nr:hypothetical protein IFM89_014171 [Coptis chinensis]